MPLPICQSITSRMTVMGLPYTVWMMCVGTLMFVLLLKMYVCLPVVGLGIIILYVVYSHDQWFFYGWISHLRLVLHDSTEFEP